MSGLNPFRPRKSEDFTAHQRRSQSSPSVLSASTPLDPIFLGHPSSVAVAVSQTKPNVGTSSAPPLSSNTTGFDGSSTFNGRSNSDPFVQPFDVSDDDVEQGQIPPEIPASAFRDTRPTLASVSTSRPLDLSRSTGRQTVTVADRPGFDDPTGIPDDTAITSSRALDKSATLEETDSGSATDEDQANTIPTTTGRSTSIGLGIDPSALATRPGNRERVPPPPPKSHHGRLISPNLNSTSPASKTSGKAVNRVSFDGSFSENVVSARILQGDSDYFHSSTSQSAPTDALRRSQSQHKRPPTPPLSRRHSHVRRSKSTLSKPSPHQLSIRSPMTEASTSTPSSPGSRSLTPSLRNRDSGNDASVVEGSRSKSTLSSENVEPTSPLQRMEASGLENQSNPRVLPKHTSASNHLPPLPPPRRTRGRNHGSEDDRIAGLPQEQRADGPENYVPQPSVAKDILADLSRLQKEVDDLRGHYENRKAQ